MENPVPVVIVVDGDVAPPEPAQQRFQAWEDWLGKFLPGGPNYIGVDANSVEAEPQQHTRWILLCLLVIGFIGSFCAMYLPIFLGVSYIDSFEPKPIIILLVLFLMFVAFVLCLAVSAFFLIFCWSGICEYCLRFPAQYRLTDNLLHI
jgi:hypothetical protein